MQPSLTDNDDHTLHPVKQQQQQNGNQTIKIDTNGIQALTPIDTNGVSSHAINGAKEQQIAIKMEEEDTDAAEAQEEEKIALPVEMASMVPLRALLGKLVHKAHSDLMTLVDTLPSMSDVEKKRQILRYSTFIRKQFAKVLVLVKWAENADDIQMCQNIMAFLANQNKTFQDTVDYLHKIHTDLPAARLRNFDIPTAVDVLTTGTYQRMPTKIKDLMAPARLTDEEVLETFQNMNDMIRMRMITTEVLPSPMLNTYRIQDGRIYFTIKNEFEVALTLMGPPNDRRWWIVSLDLFVQATSIGGGTAEDIDLSLSDIQKQHLRTSAQKQLVPPVSPPPSSSQQTQVSSVPTTTATATGATATVQSATDEAGDKNQQDQQALFFPLVNLYDFLHLCCLNMQLEILYIQSALLAKTRWVNQLQVQMNPERTKLSLIYWHGGSLASQWARPQPILTSKSTVIDIYVQEHPDYATLMSAPEKTTAAATIKKAVRDEYKGLIQNAGIGASIALDKINDNDERMKVLYLLKYPKDTLQALWNDHPDLYTDTSLLDPADLNVEQLVLHITNYHGKCMIEKFRQVLLSQQEFLEENGIYLMDEDNDGQESDGDKDAAQHPSQSPTLVIRYQHEKYISIEIDPRTGKVKAFDTNDGCGEAKLRGLEDRLNHDPVNIAQHLVWLRSEVVIREVISLAKQLNLQPYHPSQMNLRVDDFNRLFEDSLLDAATTATTSGNSVLDANITSSSNGNKYPSHCVFLQFSQFEDWYLVMAIITNKFHTWLCCIKKTSDQQHGVYHTIADYTNFNAAQLWKEQFADKSLEAHHGSIQRSAANKRALHNENEDLLTSDASMQEIRNKKRRTSAALPNSDNDAYSKRIQNISTRATSSTHTGRIDNLTMDLRFLAKLDSLSRAWIINRKIELQILSYKGSLTYHTRWLLYSLSLLSKSNSGSGNLSSSNSLQHLSLDIQAAHSHPAADKMDDCCVVIQQKLNETNKDVRRLLQSDFISLQQKRRDSNDTQHKDESPSEKRILGDHISLDKSALILSFTYPKIDTCIEQFLLDWERIIMMVNLTRQISSVWFKKYTKDQLQFHPTDLHELSFTYAKTLICTIKWSSPGREYPSQYNVEFDIKDNEEESNEESKDEKMDVEHEQQQYEQSPTYNTVTEKSWYKKKKKRSVKGAPTLSIRNPHWRIANFLRDVLNEKRDLIYFVQILFQTLPLMTCLERLETKCIQSGDVGKVSIIPRAYDSVRVIFSAIYAIDIHFADTAMVCVSDAAYHSDFYSSSSTASSYNNNNNNNNNNTNNSFIPPPPYLVPHQPQSQTQVSTETNENSTSTTTAASTTTNSSLQEQQQQPPPPSSTIKPIKVAQQFKFTPFNQFSEAVKSLETWIFDDEEGDGQDQQSKSKNDSQYYYDHYSKILPTPSNTPNSSFKLVQGASLSSSFSSVTNPCAYPLQFGLLCSASLCENILNKLQAMV